MKKVRKLAARKFDECYACKKRQKTDWYQWIDVHIEIGKIISTKVCRKCTTNWVGRKNKRLEEILK